MTTNCITNYQPFDLSIKGLTYLDGLPLETFCDYVKKIVAVASTFFLIIPIFVLDGIFSSIYSVCSIVTYILPYTYAAPEPPANYAILIPNPLYCQDDGRETTKHSLQLALELLDTETKDQYLQALIHEPSEDTTKWVLASGIIYGLVNKNIAPLPEDEKLLYISFRKLNQTQQESIVKKLLIPPFQGDLSQEAESVVTKIQTRHATLAQNRDFQLLFPDIAKTIVYSDLQTQAKSRRREQIKAILAPWQDKPDDFTPHTLLRHVLPLYLNLLSSQERAAIISKINTFDKKPDRKIFEQLTLVSTLYIALNDDPDTLADASLQAACIAIRALNESEKESLLLQHNSSLLRPKAIAAYAAVNKYIQELDERSFIEECRLIINSPNNAP